MASELRFRQAKYPDVLQVKKLLDELENTVLDVQVFDVIFQEYQMDANTIMYVSEASNGAIIAFISCRGHRLLHHEGLVFEIQELIVTQSAQGMGIGRRLVELVQQEVQIRGAKSLEVTSNKRRKEAHAFYQSMGFRNSHEKFTIYF